MSRWGITIPLTGVPLAAHRELVQELPDLGYTDAWSAETAGADAFTPLVLASQWAPQLRLGTAIVPVYTRGPGLLAMSAATLAELAPGRFVLGIGDPDLMGRSKMLTDNGFRIRPVDEVETALSTAGPPGTRHEKFGHSGLGFHLLIAGPR